jgi:GDP-D-mannose 3', 5'-epimerase
MKAALVCGAGGFIGNHLVNRLKAENYSVRGVDLKYSEFSETEADDFIIADLREPTNVRYVIDRRFGEVTRDMGGAGYIFTGEERCRYRAHSASVNLNILDAMAKLSSRLLFVVRAHVPCAQPGRTRFLPHGGKQRLSGKPGQRVRLGEAVFRATLLGYAGNHCCDSHVARYQMFSVHWGLGKSGGKRHPPRSVERSPRPRMEEKSRYGATVSRLGHFSSSTNASKGPAVDAFQFRGPGEHRNGDHQSACCDDNGDRGARV